MNQTVMILLVTAVVTIITTIVTVRYTMLGRVLSQSASGKLKAIAARYGVLLLQVLSIVWGIIQLTVLVRDPSPVTRKDVLAIALITCAIFASGFFTLLVIAALAIERPLAKLNAAMSNLIKAANSD